MEWSLISSRRSGEKLLVAGHCRKRNKANGWYNNSLIYCILTNVFTRLLFSSVPQPPKSLQSCEFHLNKSPSVSQSFRHCTTKNPSVRLITNNLQVAIPTLESGWNVVMTLTEKLWEPPTVMNHVCLCHVAAGRCWQDRGSVSQSPTRTPSSLPSISRGKMACCVTSPWLPASKSSTPTKPSWRHAAITSGWVLDHLHTWMFGRCAEKDCGYRLKACIPWFVW